MADVWGCEQKVTLNVFLTNDRLVFQNKKVDAWKGEVSRELSAGRSQSHDQHYALLHTGKDK